MRLLVRVLGFDLLEISTEPELDEEFCSLDGGSTVSTPVGFGSAPFEYDPPEHINT